MNSIYVPSTLEDHQNYVYEHSQFFDNKFMKNLQQLTSCSQ